MIFSEIDTIRIECFLYGHWKCAKYVTCDRIYNLFKCRVTNLFRLSKMICDNLEIWNVLNHYKRIKIKCQIEFNIKNNIFIHIKRILISLINIIKASREIFLCKWRYYIAFIYIISLCDLQSLFPIKKKKKDLPNVIVTEAKTLWRFLSSFISSSETIWRRVE